MGIGKFFKGIFRDIEDSRKLAQEFTSSNGGPTLNVYGYNGNTILTTFGNSNRLSYWDAEELTKNLSNEKDAESPRAGVVIFPRELTEEDFERLREEYNVHFNLGISVDEKNKGYYRLNDLIKPKR